MPPPPPLLPTMTTKRGGLPMTMRRPISACISTHLCALAPDIACTDTAGAHVRRNCLLHTRGKRCADGRGCRLTPLRISGVRRRGQTGYLRTHSTPPLTCPPLPCTGRACVNVRISPNLHIVCTSFDRYHAHIATTLHKFYIRSAGAHVRSTRILHNPYTCVGIDRARTVARLRTPCSCCVAARAFHIIPPRHMSCTGCANGHGHR